MGKEWAILHQAIAGNPDAQDQLFACHLGRLYHIAFSLLRNKADAEDAVQDGLSKAYSNLRFFEGRPKFSSWLARIVINAALIARRKKSAHPEASLDEILDRHSEQLLRGTVGARPDPEKLCAAIEIQAFVDKRVRELTPGLQAAFRLNAVNGLSAKESSRTPGIPESALKSRILRARQKLAFALQQTA